MLFSFSIHLQLVHVVIENRILRDSGRGRKDCAIQIKKKGGNNETINKNLEEMSNYKKNALDQS